MESTLFNHNFQDFKCHYMPSRPADPYDIVRESFHTCFCCASVSCFLFSSNLLTRYIILCSSVLRSINICHAIVFSLTKHLYHTVQTKVAKIEHAKPAADDAT